MDRLADASALRLFLEIEMNRRMRVMYEFEIALEHFLELGEDLGMILPLIGRKVFAVEI